MLQRKFYSNFKMRKVAFYDWQQGLIIGDGLRITKCAPDVPQLLAHLYKAKIDFCFLVCEKTELTREWFFSWSGTTASYNHEYRSGNYSFFGADIQIKHAGVWFDLEETTTAQDCYYNWLRIRNQLANHTSGQVPAMSSPSQSGLRMLEVCLPGSTQFPELESSFAEFIRANTPQARKEVFYKTTSQLNGSGFYYYDARWAYAACASIELPGALIGTMENIEESYNDVFGDSFWQGWLTVDFAVPDEWQGIGLLPVKTPTGFIWPKSGSFFNVTITAREARMAWVHGWKMTVKNAWKFSTVRPLRTWTEKLIEMRGAIDCPLYKSAIRNIMLHSIGAMYSNSFLREIGIAVENFADVSETMSRKQRLSAVRMGEQLRTVETVAKDARQAKYYMPHWTAQIWAECRIRLARQMMATNTGRIIACNLDAIYYTDPQIIADNGKVGAFRLKGKLTSNQLMPVLENLHHTSLGWNELELIKEEAEYMKGGGK